MASRPAIGVGLMAGGAVLAWGGVSGRLAPMLAALFFPSALKPSDGNTASLWALPELAAVPPASGGALIPGAGSGGPGAPELPSGGGGIIDVPSVPALPVSYTAPTSIATTQTPVLA